MRSVARKGLLVLFFPEKRTYISPDKGTATMRPFQFSFSFSLAKKKQKALVRPTLRMLSGNGRPGVFADRALNL